MNEFSFLEPFDGSRSMNLAGFLERSKGSIWDEGLNHKSRNTDQQAANTIIYYVYGVNEIDKKP